MSTSNLYETPHFHDLGEQALVATFADGIAVEISQRIFSLVARLDALEPSGLEDMVASYTTITCLLSEPDAASAIRSLVTREWQAIRDAGVDVTEARTVTIPVRYGGVDGPDLEDVASHAGLTPDEVIEMHTGGEYFVAALGFSPGFGYLIGLPDQLATPRRSTPRTRVPAGSVAIGGAQTAVYPLASPGGWSLIGRTPLPMLDPGATSIDDALTLRAGDRVVFRSLSAEAEASELDVGPSAEVSDVRHPVLEVIAPGVETTVQDPGRRGLGRFGLAPGGAASPDALIRGNRLLGTADDASALEVTLLAPTLRVLQSTRLVVTGEGPGFLRNGNPVVNDMVIPLSPGDLLSPASGQPSGMRSWLCLHGGIDVPLVFGSRSTSLTGGFGGHYGRALRAGDRLSTGEEFDDTPRPVSGKSRQLPNPLTVRLMRGPEAERFSDAAWTALLTEGYTVSPQSNRVGIRLSGPSLEADGEVDIVSRGLVTGAVQVVGGGQPIVMLPDRATIGGYAVMAVVISADHWLLAQARPGARVRFREVSREEAVAVRQHSETDSAPPIKVEDPMPEAANDWTPAAVLEIVREIATQDIEEFQMEIAAAGISLHIRKHAASEAEISWSNDSPSEATQLGAPVDERLGSDHNGELVTAPVLGVFYRRPSPEEPPYATPGDPVAANQVLGVIEVMKTYYDVMSPCAGVLAEFLIDDGQPVEFGTPLALVTQSPSARQVSES